MSGPSGNHKLKAKHCRACDAQFVVQNNSGKMFCTPICRGEWDAVATCKPVSFTVMRAKCEDCGQRFIPAQRRSRFCSGVCSARSDQKAKTLAKRVARPCPECATVFTPPYGRGHSTFCSNACAKRSNKRVHRKRERARLRCVSVEAVNPTVVFDRDGWRCHLCGCSTPRRLRGTHHDKAPELDHIIPLAKGGEHSYRNTACACRKCNGVKSDAIKGQMLLFG